MRFVFGLFMVLHGLVHLLYLAHSAKCFQLTPGLAWPVGSWVFSRLLGDGMARGLAIIALALAAIGFVAGGVGVFAAQAWWRPVVAGAATLSSVIYILFWNGRMQNLSGQGAIALVINTAILLAVLVFRWPNV
jgi:hypothetical protein